MKPRRFDVLGVKISAVNMREALDEIFAWIQRGDKKYVCVTGVHGVMESQNDPFLKKIHNSSGLTVPDGMPMVWAGRLGGHRNIARVYGPDLMLEVSRLSAREGCSHFFYGGVPGVAEQLKKNFEKRFPGIRIVGVYTPPFGPLSENEYSKLHTIIRRVKPDIFWVGLGAPKQERFMGEYIDQLDVKVMIGVGAAFDIHTGRTRDAPILFKKTGMQWLYRLRAEPKRLWKRYLINNPLFVFKYLKQLMRFGRA